MRIKVLVAAIAALALPGQLAAAEPEFKYADMVHCAGVHLVAKSIMSMGDGETKNADTIATLNKQAAALMTFASLNSKKSSDAVLEELNAESEKVMAKVAAEDTGAEYFKGEFSKCNDWGKAAVMAIEEITKKS